VPYPFGTKTPTANDALDNRFPLVLNVSSEEGMWSWASRVKIYMTLLSIFALIALILLPIMFSIAERCGSDRNGYELRGKSAEA
jgi:hypothetical protein